MVCVTRSRGAAMVLAAGLLVGACGGGSGYRYEKNASSGTYFKVPSRWAAVDTQQLANPDGSLLGQAALKQLDWARSFDSSAVPTPNHFLPGQAASPTVQVVVRPILTTERDAFSLDDLRTGTDLVPIPDADTLRKLRLQEAQNLQTNTRAQVESNGFQVLLDQPLLAKGFRGVHFRFSGTVGTTDTVWDVIGWVDDATTVKRTMVVSCVETCFTANASVINTVTSSFTVKER